MHANLFKSVVTDYRCIHRRRNTSISSCCAEIAYGDVIVIVIVSGMTTTVSARKSETPSPPSGYGREMLIPRFVARREITDAWHVPQLSFLQTLNGDMRKIHITAANSYMRLLLLRPKTSQRARQVASNIRDSCNVNPPDAKQRQKSNDFE